MDRDNVVVLKQGADNVGALNKGFVKEDCVCQSLVAK